MICIGLHRYISQKFGGIGNYSVNKSLYLVVRKFSIPYPLRGGKTPLRRSSVMFFISEMWLFYKSGSNNNVEYTNVCKPLRASMWKGSSLFLFPSPSSQARLTDVFFCSLFFCSCLAMTLTPNWLFFFCQTLFFPESLILCFDSCSNEHDT